MQGEWSSKKKKKKKCIHTHKKQNKRKSYVQIRRESRNNGMESLDMNPQARDQSNNVPVNNAINWSIKCSGSSKMWLLHSLQIIQKIPNIWSMLPQPVPPPHQ